MNLYIPFARSEVSDQITRSWNLASQPGNSITQSIGVGSASGRIIMPVYFADLSHPEDKHWRSLFIPLGSNTDAGISITWWARRAGLAGNTNIKPDTLSKWLGVLKSKIIGGDYTINSIMCPPESHLPSRTKWLSGFESNPNWFPSFAYDYKSTITVSPENFYAGMLTSNALIIDFLKFMATREDLVGVLEQFELSPLTFFGVNRGPEVTGVVALKKAVAAALPFDLGGDIKKGKNSAKPIEASVEIEKPATKEERYAGVWGAFG